MTQGTRRTGWFQRAGRNDQKIHFVVATAQESLCGSFKWKPGKQRIVWPGEGLRDRLCKACLKRLDDDPSALAADDA